MRTHKLRHIVLASVVAVSAGLFVPTIKNEAASAACAAQDTSRGVVTSTVTVPTTGTYRVWSRIQASSSSNNSYILEIDDTTCGIIVGDSSSIPVNTWYWVDHRDANTASKVNVTLSAGTHSIKMIGREDNVKLDRLVLTADTTCMPTDLGDNCSNPADTTPPTVSLTAPANGATLSNSTTVTANATDANGVARVEFYVDGVIKTTDTVAPYSYTWDTTKETNGTHTVRATAVDSAGNSANSTQISVTINNTVVTPLKAGDVNGDNAINVFDLAILASNYQKTGMTRAQGDLNGDGSVTILDLSILSSNWGK